MQREVAINNLLWTSIIGLKVDAFNAHMSGNTLHLAEFHAGHNLNKLERFHNRWNRYVSRYAYQTFHRDNTFRVNLRIYVFQSHDLLKWAFRLLSSSCDLRITHFHLWINLHQSNDQKIHIKTRILSWIIGRGFSILVTHRIDRGEVISIVK